MLLKTFKYFSNQINQKYEKDLKFLAKFIETGSPQSKALMFDWFQSVDKLIEISEFMKAIELNKNSFEMKNTSEQLSS